MTKRMTVPSGNLTDQIYYKMSEGLKKISETPLPDFTGPEYQKEVSPGVFAPDEIKIQNELQKSSDNSRNSLARLIADNIILGSNEGCLPLNGGVLSGKLVALYGLSAGINGKEVLNIYTQGINACGVQIKGELRLESDTLYINNHPVINYKNGILTLDAKQVVCTGKISGDGGGSQSIYIIKDQDITEAKDDNVYSALKVKNAFSNLSAASEQKYLRKDQADSTNFPLNFMGGINIGTDKGQYGTIFDSLGCIYTNRIISHDYIPGMLGTGYKLYNRATNGHSYLEVDELFVRVKAFLSEMEIKKLSYAGGNWVFSPAGMTCSKVEETQTYYRCYFVAENKEGTIKNDFRVDDLVKMKEYNVDSHTLRNVSNRYFWRRCIAVGKDYIDLSITDCDSSVLNDAPKVGDSLVTFGNKTDQSRQNVVVISAYGDGSPSVVQYVGIKDYTTTGTEKTRISPTSGNLLTGEFVFESGENVREYTDSQIQNVVTTSNQKIDKIVNDLAGNISITNQIQKEVDDIKKQSDGAIDTWFYDAPPTLTNEPAVNWKTEEEKKKHIADLYYDKDGLSYRFEKRDGQYQWKLIRDSGLSDALSRLDKMESTVDKKMRVFVRQPKFEESYAEGDLWIDAVYTDNSHDFSHDLLRCVTPKAVNVSFDINHWKLATKYTDDTVANQAIKNAANAQLAADNAKQKAVEAQQRMSDWVSDKVISPIEKKGLKDEIVRIDADKAEITKGYIAYNLGEPSSYLPAYTKYREQLMLLSSPEPECRPVPDTFVTDQSEYYNQRTLALYAISNAAKNHIDNGLANMREVYEGRFTATDKLIEGRLEKSVYQADKNGIDAKIAAAESAISQTAEKIGLMVTKEIYDAGIKSVTDGLARAEASISVQAEQITQQVGKITVLEGTVAEHSSWITTAPDAISAKVKKEVNGELSLTGIDITNKKIILTAEKTEIKDGDKTIAFFSSDAAGGIKFSSNVYCTYVQANKGNIGSFDITNNGLSNVSESPTAYINISDHIGNQANWNCFSVNHDNNSFCDVRSVSKNAISALTHTGTAIYANGGNFDTIEGYALRTDGNVYMQSDKMGTILMEGNVQLRSGQFGHVEIGSKDYDRYTHEVKVHGLALHSRKITNFDNDVIRPNDDFIIASEDRAFVTIPRAEEVPGKIIFLKLLGNTTVRSYSPIHRPNNKSVFKKGGDGYYWDTFDGRSIFFINDGTDWYCFSCYYY